MSGLANAVRQATDPEGTRSFPLWFGALAPPLAWASHLLLADGIYELGCAPGFGAREIYGLSFLFWAVLQTSLLLVVDVAAGLLALRAFRVLRAPQPMDEKGATRRGRARGMAVVGMASSAIYGLLLVYGLFPPFVLEACAVTP